MSDHKVLNAMCRDSFDAFAMRAFRIIEPGTDYTWSWHIGCIAEHLEASFRGEIPKLIINIPPRTLKSVLVAQLYPAWAMGKEPHHQFIGASYAHSLAERNVMRARQVIQDDWYKECFPETILSADQNQKDFFTTTQAGQYKGTGIGGTVTGFGCRTLICDDVLNPVEAASDTVRATVMREIRSTLFSRFNKMSESRFIMIMQRLHESDPTGELLKDMGYHLVKLPAEAKQPVRIALKERVWEMDAGELLTPRLTRKDLDQLRTDLTEYQYVGQYLQEPVPVGGGEFHEEWLQYYQQAKPRTMNVVIIVDPSGGEAINKKKKKTGDFTVMDVWGLGTDNNYYLLDRIRDRLNPTDRVEALFTLHRKWNEICGKPPKCGYEKYGMQGDIHYIKEKQKMESYNFPIVELSGQMMKEERIRRLIPDMQNGRFYFPTSLSYLEEEGRLVDLIEEMRSEMRSFPRSRYDDILDTMSRLKDPELGVTFPRPKTTKHTETKRTENWIAW